MTKIEFIGRLREKLEKARERKRQCQQFKIDPPSRSNKINEAIAIYEAIAITECETLELVIDMAESVSTNKKISILMNADSEYEKVLNRL